MPRVQAKSGSPARVGGIPGLPAAAGLLAVICVVAFWNSFQAGLLLDNQTILLRDPRLRAVDWEGVRAVFAHQYWWPTAESQLYRPLTTLSYWFNYSVLGGAEQATGYHAVNLLLHWVAAALAFALVRAVSGRGWLALAAAAVFAVHPLTVESVTNVVGRADILAALSVMGGLLLYRRFRGSSGRRAAAALGGLGAVYLAGVFCKESAVVLPAALLLHDIAFPAERGTSAL